MALSIYSFIVFHLLVFFYFAVVTLLIEFIPPLILHNYSLFSYHAPQHLQPPALATLCPMPALLAACGASNQIRANFCIVYYFFLTLASF